MRAQSRGIVKAAVRMMIGPSIMYSANTLLTPYSALICWANHKPSTTMAGNSITVKNRMMKIKVNTRARGYKRM